jgi:hypothetical protein
VPIVCILRFGASRVSCGQVVAKSQKYSARNPVTTSAEETIVIMASSKKRQALKKDAKAKAQKAQKKAIKKEQYSSRQSPQKKKLAGKLHHQQHSNQEPTIPFSPGHKILLIGEGMPRLVRSNTKLRLITDSSQVISHSRGPSSQTTPAPQSSQPVTIPRSSSARNTHKQIA